MKHVFRRPWRRRTHRRTVFGYVPIQGGNVLRVAVVCADRKAPIAKSVEIRSQLEAEGHIVWYVDDDGPAILDETHFDVIVVTDDVNFTTYGTRDQQTRCGVVLTIGALQDEFLMATTNTNTATQTQIDIDSPFQNHPLWNGTVSTGLQTLTSVSATFNGATTANLAPGSKALGQVGSSTTHLAYACEAGHQDTSSEYFNGRRVFLGYFNAWSDFTTLAWDIFKDAVIWAGWRNAAANIVVETVGGAGADHATYTAALSSISGQDNSTIEAGGRAYVFLKTGTTDEQLIVSDTTLYLDRDCTVTLDFNRYGNSFSGTLTAADDLVRCERPHYFIGNGWATHTGSWTGSGGSSSGAKLTTPAAFSFFYNFQVFGLRAPCNMVGMSSNGPLGGGVINCGTHTIDVDTAGFTPRGMRSDPSSNSAWPMLFFGSSTANIGNNSVSPLTPQGMQFLAGSGDETNVYGCAAANVNGDCFNFSGAGTIVTAYLASDDATADDNGDNLATHLVSQTTADMFKSASVPVNLEAVPAGSGGVLVGASVSIAPLLGRPNVNARLAFDYHNDPRPDPPSIGFDEPFFAPPFFGGALNVVRKNVWLRR